ncbi:tonB-system energizer ExbB [Thalassovita aquimarina]|uniref:Biopolymer transport protein ExbB n=1 Tax=Thalassovita aquimarina TaxID=2785917 RepID=A0ABS5HR63_9RHOB|nr:tonB-system energizer ExbB [Thalassovita aquimarina]MBR9651296.1 tonB-system energizer ExbB [Thalassovita aquimarina]
MTDLALHDLSPLGMYRNADWVVQWIMLGLLAASVLSWTVLFAKMAELFAARIGIGRGLRLLRRAETLKAVQEARGPVARMLAETETELAQSGRDLPPVGIKDRLALRLSRIEAAEARRIARGIGILATIGSIAPFVGLFGTVWGIMNSFISIAQSQTTSLAVVAPGIAEALLATAMGLGAAIPAVVIYNGLGRVIAAHRARIADAGVLVLAIAGRDLDRAGTGG